MQLPKPRGSLTERLFAALTDADTSAPTAALRTRTEDHPDEDGQLALWTLYRLHDTGFTGVDDALEWDPALLAVRRRLEQELEDRLRERYAAGDLHELAANVEPAEIGSALLAFVDAHDGASVAAEVHRRAAEEQVLQVLRLRSLYHLREADPTTWVIPRLGVATKAAVVELQYDEYGGGDPRRLHSGLFARGMAACGLDPTPFGYVDEAPAEALEMNNAMDLFGLHRRLRGAALGHLAAFEATSSLPSRRMAQGLERLGLPVEMQAYYLEHVEADAVHEQLAARVVCGALLREQPDLLDDVFLGAFSCLDLEDRFAGRLRREWARAEEPGAA